MVNRRTLAAIFIVPLLTVIAIYGYRIVPSKTLVINTHKTPYTQLFSDGAVGKGDSEVSWVKGTVNAWKCILVDTAEHPFCGITFDTKKNYKTGLDLSDFNKVKLDIEYKGPAKQLRLSIRNFDERYSSIENIDSSKFNSAIIRTSDLNDTVTVFLNEFSVADWWIEQYEVPREHSKLAFDNVIALGLDFPHPHAFGEHLVSINSVEFEGQWISKERWYFGILTLWIIIALGFGSVVAFGIYRRSLIDSRRLAELANLNQQLQEESSHYKHLSTTDPVTGFSNRVGFTQKAEKIISAQQDEEYVSLMLLEVDNIPRIQQRMGRAGVESAILKVAEAITDNAQDIHLIGRWDSDEFIILCEKSVSSIAYIFAESLRKSIREIIVEHNNSPIAISASIGVAQFAKDEDILSAFKRANMALNKARDMGKNRTVIAGESRDVEST